MDLRPSTSKQEQPNGSTTSQKICAFCYKSADDPLLYGELKTVGNLTAHYYCVLMSTALQQRGGDHEGFSGFLLVDIYRELRNSRNQPCCYCLKKNATVCCTAKDCRRIFHFPCGLKQHANFVFCDDFHSFCHLHNPNRGRNTRRYLALDTFPPPCIYCQDLIRPEHDYYVTECCRSCAMHMTCLKRHATSVGYFTKCPNCNNNNRFVRSIRNHGVFVPTVDALWELDNDIINGYELQVECGATVCKCPHGGHRDHNASRGHCKIRLCRICGGNAVHQRCKGSRGYRYVCAVCRPVVYKRRPKRILAPRQFTAAYFTRSVAASGVTKLLFAFCKREAKVVLTRWSPEQLCDMAAALRKQHKQRHGQM